MVSTVEVNLNNWWNDHVVYANGFLYANDDSNIVGGDMLFRLYNQFVRKLTDSYIIYFFITALIYTGCYYWSCIKNKYMIVKYDDGSKELISEALENKHIDIQVLDKFNISYIKEEK